MLTVTRSSKRFLKLDNKFKGRIINALRKLTYYYPERNEAKRRQKVAPSAFQCQECFIVVYEGSSISRVKTLQEELDCDVIGGKVHIDHIMPVVPITGFGVRKTWDWNIYIHNMFCPVEGFQVLCKECHAKKTGKENELRKVYKTEKLVKNKKKRKKGKKKK